MEFSDNGFSPRPDDGACAEGGSFNFRDVSGKDRHRTGRGPNTTLGRASAIVSTDAGTVRVLVVDDQPDVLTTTAELFKLMGYEVLSASNGDEAVAILKSTPDIQVLFSDVVMPGMNGFKLGQEARRLIPDINVILASGFQGEAIGAGGADAVGFHFLVKPYRMADVARVLRK